MMMMVDGGRFGSGGGREEERELQVASEMK
jgi:hypothetical protein